jgi:nucleotide-binding universal stress UspA family protein
MTVEPALITVEHVLIACALVIGLAAGYLIARSRRRGRRSERPEEVHQILLPFTGTEISRRAVDAALRLARAERATLMPAYLAEVPKQLPLECSIPVEAAKAMPMLEAIEQRATSQDVPVDARIERGRSYRHALQRLLEHEEFERVVVPAGADEGAGLSGDDLVWLLEKVPTEVMILRPGPEDERIVSANGAGAPSPRTVPSPNRPPPDSARLGR